MLNRVRAKNTQSWNATQNPARIFESRGRIVIGAYFAHGTYSEEHIQDYTRNLHTKKYATGGTHYIILFFHIFFILPSCMEYKYITRLNVLVTSGHHVTF